MARPSRCCHFPPMAMKWKRKKKRTTKKRWWAPTASSAASRKPRLKTSRVASSARKIKKWPSSSSLAAAARTRTKNRPSLPRKPAATIPALAVAARNTKNATGPDPSRYFRCLRLGRHLAGAFRNLRPAVGESDASRRRREWQASPGRRRLREISSVGHRLQRLDRSLRRLARNRGKGLASRQLRGQLYG